MELELARWPAQSVFFGIGLLVAAGVLAVAARWRRVAVAEVFALFGGCALAGFAGARLAWIVLAPDAAKASLPWRAMLDPTAGGFASVGLLAGAGLVAAGAIAAAGERAWCWLDALVPAGLVGLAAARLGCLANGCDWGRPADLAWAVRYPAASPPWHTHLGEGLIEAGQVWSAPVHPLPAYLAVASITVAIGALVWLWRHRPPAGAVATTAAAGYLALRLVAELFRAPQTVGWQAGAINVHHLVLGAALAVVVGLALRRRQVGVAPGAGSRDT